MCKDTSSDPLNCGDCFKECPAYAEHGHYECKNGVCELVCEEGYIVQDGKCALNCITREYMVINKFPIDFCGCLRRYTMGMYAWIDTLPPGSIVKSLSLSGDGTSCDWDNYFGRFGLLNGVPVGDRIASHLHACSCYNDCGNKRFAVASIPGGIASYRVGRENVLESNNILLMVDTVRITVSTCTSQM
jgi:hypothetical protein